MRALIWVVALLALGWSGYWFVGARALERGIQAARTEAVGDGFEATFEARVRGFPNRFDLALEDVDIADPASGLGWRADFFQIFALSYRPHHVIAVWPPEHTVTLADRSVPVRAEDLRASIRVRPVPDLPLARAVLTAEALSAGRVAVSSLRVGLQAAEGTAAGYDLGIAAENLAVPALGPLLAALPDGSGLPASVALARIDTRVTLDRPLDRHAAAGPTPALREVAVRTVHIDWGDLAIRGDGTLTVGPDGTLSGRIETRTTGWQVLPDLVVAAGFVSADVAPTVDNALRMLAGMSGPPERLDAALVIENGRMSFGPLPLGPAPRLR